MRDTLLGKRGRTALLMLGMLAGTIVVLIVYAVTVSAQNTKDIRDTQIEGTPVGKKLVAASDRILDCSEPTGQCARENRRQLARAIAAIDVNARRTAALAAACAADVPDPTDPTQILACMNDYLAAEKPRKR